MPVEAKTFPRKCSKMGKMAREFVLELIKTFLEKIPRTPNRPTVIHYDRYNCQVPSLQKYVPTGNMFVPARANHLFR